MMRIKLSGGALVTTFLLLFFSAVAGATILAPNSAVTPVPAGTENGLLVATAKGTYSTSNISGTVTKGVYANTSSTFSVCPVGLICLDFVYQFTETGGTSPVGGFAASDFDNLGIWTTDVYQSTSNAGALSIFSVPDSGTGFITDTASRFGEGPAQFTAMGGDTVQFDMADGGTVAGESNILIIKTNAPQYVAGSVSLLGSNTASSPVPPGNPPWSATFTGEGTWGPISNTNTGAVAFNGAGYSNTFLAPIPEPGFYGVLAICLAGLFLAVKYRRGKETA
jgi:hypothetical protein